MSENETAAAKAPTQFESPAESGAMSVPASKSVESSPDAATAAAMTQPAPAAARNPYSNFCIAGIAIAFVGGGAIVLGWLMPWIRVSELVRQASSSLGLLGGLLGLGALQALGSVGGDALGGLGGLGNGLQIVWVLLAFGLNMISNGGLMTGLVSLTVVGIFIALVILGVAIFRYGIKLLEVRTSPPADMRFALLEAIGQMRKFATWALVILAIIFVIMASIPFGVAIFGGTGFVLTLLGAGVTFFGAVFLKSSMPRV